MLLALVSHILADFAHRMNVQRSKIIMETMLRTRIDVDNDTHDTRAAV